MLQKWIGELWFLYNVLQNSLNCSGQFPDLHQGESLAGGRSRHPSSNWSQWELQMLYFTNQNLPVPSVISFWFEKHLGLVKIVSLRKEKKRSIIQTFPLLQSCILMRAYGKACVSTCKIQQQVLIVPLSFLWRHKDAHALVYPWPNIAMLSGAVRLLLNWLSNIFISSNKIDPWTVYFAPGWKKCKGQTERGSVRNLFSIIVWC